jgi:class 3 adenylate cyclase
MKNCRKTHPLFLASYTLGTADLNMRFGLHSGPVTAGVLRSQNARFQLFGDTVNTAARMESNGSGGMVHMSQETADELSAHGKHGTVNFLMNPLSKLYLLRRIRCLIFSLFAC